MQKCKIKRLPIAILAEALCNLCQVCANLTDLTFLWVFARVDCFFGCSGELILPPRDIRDQSYIDLDDKSHAKEMKDGGDLHNCGGLK